MQQYALENIRNLVLLSHCGAGKTSLSEAVLFAAGAITRLGKVNEGTTTSDYDPSEAKRSISLSLAILPYEWQDKKVNLIDTPGYFDFVGEVKAGIRVGEAAVVAVCAASGVEVGTEQVWAYSDEANLSRLIFINKMDRENADFYKALEQIRAQFGNKCVPIQLPIGADSSFEGIVDLLTLKSYTGSETKEGEIPASLQEQVNSFRNKLIESVAETDDELIEKYLNGEEFTPEEINTALRKAVISGKLVPVLAGSALQSVGITKLMDAILSYLPSPQERTTTVISGAEEEEALESSADAPLATLVFKTSADPYVGKLTYLRVYAGNIDSNSQVWNASRSSIERIGQLFILRGKNQEPVTRIGAGDIGAVAKLSLTSTGDTLSSQENPVKVTPITFPEPIFSEAVSPKTKADLDKLGSALTRLVEEDPTLRVRREASTGETIISGLGETHLEVAAEKMQRKFGVGVELQIPQVPYRETVTALTNAEYKHKKQTGGHGQYGHVLLELEPLPRGSDCEFASRIVGGSIPKNYIPAVEKGVKEALQEGILARFPVVGIKTTVYDGSFHPVDSSEICFKIAGAGAVRRGLSEAQSILLEPIMNIKVRIPESNTGDVIGDLNTKRARVQGMNPGSGYNVIEAQVPLAEVQRYTIDLKTITQGRGSYSVQFSHYEETPAHISQKIIADRQAVKV
ncbi:elongation factor G [Chloroflexota bacterium]